MDHVDQVTAVRHALLSSQYAALAERTSFPVELLQQMAEQCGYDLQQVEAHIACTMRELDERLQSAAARDLFVGGNAGGGKSMALRLPQHYSAEIIRGHGGIVLTCVG